MSCLLPCQCSLFAFCSIISKFNSSLSNQDSQSLMSFMTPHMYFFHYSLSLWWNCLAFRMGRHCAPVERGRAREAKDVGGGLVLPQDSQGTEGNHVLLASNS